MPTISGSSSSSAAAAAAAAAAQRAAEEAAERAAQEAAERAAQEKAEQAAEQKAEQAKAQQGAQQKAQQTAAAATQRAKAAEQQAAVASKAAEASNQRAESASKASQAAQAKVNELQKQVNKLPASKPGVKPTRAAATDAANLKGSLAKATFAAGAAAQKQADAQKVAIAAQATAQKKIAAAADAKRQESAAVAAEHADGAVQKATGAARTAQVAAQKVTRADQANQEAQAKVTALRNQLNTAPYGANGQPHAGSAKVAAQIKTNLSAAEKAAGVTGQKLTEAQRESAAAQANAVKLGDASVAAAQKANGSARAAGEAVPYPEGSLSHDVFTSGKVAASDGPGAAASPQALSSFDSAVKAGQGASALTQQLKALPTPAARAAFLAQAGPGLGQLVSQAAPAGKGLIGAITALASNAVAATSSKPSANISALAYAAQVSGPEGRQAVDSAVSAAIASGTVDPGGLNHALQDSNSQPGVVPLVNAAANAYRSAGNYASASALAKASPNFGIAAAPTRGQSEAQSAVQLTHTVSEQKAQTLSAAQKSEAATRASAQQLVSEAAHPPPGYKLESSTATSAVYAATNKNGQVVARLSASSKGGNASVVSESYNLQTGQAHVTQHVASKNTSQQTTASYQISKNASPPPADLQALMGGHSTSLSLSQTTVQVGANGSPTITQLTQDKGAISQSTTTFGQEKNAQAGGIDNHLQKGFGPGPVQTEQTESFHIPPPGYKVDGKPAQATYTRTRSYAQAGVQATAVSSEPFSPKVTGDVARNQSDLNGAIKAFGSGNNSGVDFNGSNQNPKQWTLQSSQGNTLYSQTLTEGSNVVATTKSVATGSTVQTTSSVTGLKQKGVGGESSVTYNAAGQVQHLQSKSTNSEGVTTQLSRNLTETTNPHGQREANLQTSSSTTNAKGQTQSYAQDISYQPTPGGNRILSAKSTVTSGRYSAVATTVNQGQVSTSTYSVNGVPVTKQNPASQLQGVAQQVLAAAARGNESVDPPAPAQPGDNIEKLATALEGGTAPLTLLPKYLSAKQYEPVSDASEKVRAAQEGVDKAAAETKAARASAASANDALNKAQAEAIADGRLPAADPSFRKQSQVAKVAEAAVTRAESTEAKARLDLATDQHDQSQAIKSAYKQAADNVQEKQTAADAAEAKVSSAQEALEEQITKTTKAGVTDLANDPEILKAQAAVTEAETAHSSAEAELSTATDGGSSNIKGGLYSGLEKGEDAANLLGVISNGANLVSDLIHGHVVAAAGAAAGLGQAGIPLLGTAGKVVGALAPEGSALASAGEGAVDLSDSLSKAVPVLGLVTGGFQIAQGGAVNDVSGGLAIAGTLASVSLIADVIPGGQIAGAVLLGASALVSLGGLIFGGGGGVNHTLPPATIPPFDGQ